MKIKNTLAFAVLIILVTACVGKTTAPSIFSNLDAILFASTRGGSDAYYLMKPDGTDVQKLNLGSLPVGVQIDRPIWVTVWNKFLFSATNDSNSDIYTVSPGGKGLDNLTNTPQIFETSPVVSSDGKYIAYVSIDLDLDIMVMNSDGKDSKNLTQSPARDTAAIWLPDSSHILFSSNRGGTPNIYSMDRDGKDVVDISKGPGLDSYSPSRRMGSRLYSIVTGLEKWICLSLILIMGLLSTLRIIPLKMWNLFGLLMENGSPFALIGMAAGIFSLSRQTGVHLPI